ncbi:MAG: hypothetical protein ABIL45_03460 [candidate division WOR-3 bacterium]
MRYIVKSFIEESQVEKYLSDLENDFEFEIISFQTNSFVLPKQQIALTQQQKAVEFQIGIVYTLLIKIISEKTN